MGLLDKFRQGIVFNPYVNTGTLLDLATGKFRQSTNGGWVLDGGLSQCMGVTGRAQTYKSTLAASFMVKALENHPLAEAYVYETESAVPDAERYDSFVSVPGTKVSDRIVFKNSTVCSLEQFYNEFIDIIEDKLARKKEFLVDSPFLDPRTNEPYKVWIPTIILVDSFSRAQSGTGASRYSEKEVDDSAFNTYWMNEGKTKTLMMSDLPSRAAKAGAYVIMTAHMGNKMDLDPYNKSGKQLQYMKNSDKMKNVGSTFEFLTTSLIQTMRATALKDDKNQCQYPLAGQTNPVEVNEVETAMIRCKNNASGVLIPFIVSQYFGILDALTSFNFIKKPSFGLNNQNNRFYSSKMLPEKKFSRMNIREMTESDYTLRRALDLTAQIMFIQTLWNTRDLPSSIHTPIDRVAEILDKNNSLSDRILHSTGVWSSSKMEREHLSVIDVLDLIGAEDKDPKSVAVTATK